MKETSTHTFTQLIYNCRKGDRNSQKELYTIIAPVMYALVSEQCYSQKGIEEVMVNGFLQLFNSLNTYNPQVDFTDWASHFFITTAAKRNIAEPNYSIVHRAGSIYEQVKENFKSLIPGL